VFLPSPRRVCFRRCLFVCLLAALRKKLPNGFAWNVSSKVSNESLNKWLNFGDDPDHCLESGIVFRIFVTIGRYWKWLTDTNLLFIPIHQMAALVRCASTGICTVTVLLAFVYIFLIFDISAILRFVYVFVCSYCSILCNRKVSNHLARIDVSAGNSLSTP